MTHIDVLTQSENTGLYFADVRVKLVNVADSAVRARVRRSGLQLFVLKSPLSRPALQWKIIKTFVLLISTDVCKFLK